MTDWNPDCRLRLRTVRCAKGTPCAGFRHSFFGALGMSPDGKGAVRMIYHMKWTDVESGRSVILRVSDAA